MITFAVLLALSSSAPPPPHVVAGERARLHLRLDADALYGIGAQSFLGADLGLFGDAAVWHTTHASGTVGGGVALVFHHEPTWLAPWIDRDHVQGANDRVQALLSVGHTIHLGKRRRSSLGLHLYGGLNHWRSAYRVDYSEEGLVGHAVLRRSGVVLGGQLRYAYRISERVGVNVQLGGPFGPGSSYVRSMFQVGVGLTLYLR